MFLRIFQLYIFVEIARLQELVPILAQLQTLKILAAASIFGTFFITPRTHIADCLRSPQSKGIALLFILMVLSVPLSVYPGNSFRFITQIYWKNIVLFYLILAYGYSDLSIDRIISAYIAGIGISACIGAFMETSDRLAITESTDSNELALRIVVLLPLVLWRLVSGRRLQKIIALCICGLMLVTLAKTGSRGGFLGLAGVMMIVLWQFRSTYRRYFKTGLVACFLIFGIVFFRSDSELSSRITSIIDYQSDYNYTAEAGRLSIWKRGIGLMLYNPVLGVGINNFTAAEGMSKNEGAGRWNAAHNAFIEIGTELGFPGLIVFCYLIWVSTKLLNQARAQASISRNQSHVVLSGLIIACWVGYLVTASFLSAASTSIFNVLVALSCVVAKQPTVEAWGGKIVNAN